MRRLRDTTRWDDGNYHASNPALVVERWGVSADAFSTLLCWRVLVVPNAAEPLIEACVNAITEANREAA